MSDWEDVTALLFVPWAGQPNFIHIRNSDGDTEPECSSQVGMVGGQQIINITTGCLSNFKIHHEIAHALGFRHEQSRKDRDIYVTINWCNIEGSLSCDPNPFGMADNFQIAPSSNAYGPYDFDSVMHYGATAFVQCGAFPCSGAACTTTPCTTIDVNPPYDTEWQSQIGQRNHLSTWDQLVMSFLYPESDWRFYEPAIGGAGSGTFLDPWGGTFQNALDSTPSGGVLIVLHGTTVPPMEISKSITLRAPLGGLTLGG